MTNTNNGLFNPNGCLTFKALREYLDGTLRMSVKLEVEKHLKHCRICSEALDGYIRHYKRILLGSDLEFLSNKARRRYSSAQIRNQRLPVMIAVSIVVSLIILLVVYLIIRHYLLNQ
jgi:predicted anti-sigma-YlaC factor YlaD